MIFNSFAMMKGGSIQDYDRQHQQQQELVMHQQQSSLKRESLSDEVDSEEHKKQKLDTRSSGSGSVGVGGGGGGGGDGASIEAGRRPRGRPPGSKNKPKPPIIITREADPSSAMRPHVLEIPGGLDITDALSRFSRRRNLGICVLSGTGTVVNVALRHQPPPPPEAAAAAATTVGFRGRFEILSLSATFLPPSLSAVSAPPSVSISLAGPQGQVVGGTVAGPLVAAGTVVLVAAAFSNPTFHRLPAEEEVSVSLSGGGGGDVIEGSGQELDYKYDHGQDQGPHLHHQQHHRQQAVAMEPCSMAMYSCHLPSEVIWVPPSASRAPPPPPPY